MSVNATSSEGIDFSNTGKVVGLVFLTILGIITIVNNTLVIHVYLKHKDLRIKAMTFVMNLCIADLLTGILIMGSVILDILGFRLNSFSLCIGSREGIMYLNNVTKFLTAAATFERYVGICQRKRYTNILTTKFFRTIVAASWTLPIPMSFVVLFGENHWQSVRKCDFPELIPNWLLTVESTLTFLTIVFSVTLYTQILLKARKIYRRVNPAQHIALNSISSQARSIRHGKIVGVLTMVFIICWFPHDIVTIFYVLGFRGVDKIVRDGVILMGLLNSATNSFLYVWQKKEFRKKLKEMKCRKQKKKNDIAVECISMEDFRFNE